ncbi:hypothetical protein GCM10017778_54610 [Streptomyces vinaceus]|nr:hypothetical protein GCM10017778_54610 [Streptomyces vinaceus]
MAPAARRESRVRSGLDAGDVISLHALQCTGTEAVSMATAFGDVTVAPQLTAELLVPGA